MPKPTVPKSTLSGLSQSKSTTIRPTAIQPTAPRPTLLEPTSSQPTLLRIIYDVDGVLWDICGALANYIGVSRNLFTTYDVDLNPALSISQILALRQAFIDPELFSNMRFYDGAQEILELEQLSNERYQIRVEINSYNCSEEVRRIKREQLFAAIPGLNPEYVHLGVIGVQDHTPKSIEGPVLALVDDSPYNVAGSPARINFMPRNSPWTTSPHSVRIMAGRRVVWCSTLREINCSISEYIKRHIALLEHQSPSP